MIKSISVTIEELNKILKQMHIDYDYMKGQDIYQVYYYDSLGHLISIVQYKAIRSNKDEY